MQLNFNLAKAITETLKVIFDEKRYADKAIEIFLKQNASWRPDEKQFFVETTYDIVRFYRLLQTIANVPSNDYWSLIGCWCILHKIPLPDWKQFKGLSPPKIHVAFDKFKSVRSISESVPDWLDELGEKELSGRWNEELHALNKQADAVLRANALKISTTELQQLLLKENIKTELIFGVPHGLVLKQKQNVFRTQAFKDGLFEVQDAASQLIAPFIQIEPGMRVIDACAGAGGKTLHIATLLKNKGRLIAMDTEAWKLDELKKRARRAQATNIETRVIESTKVIKRLKNSADRLLLDVPCSGIGVFKRNPDAKWKLTPESLVKVRELQYYILDYYSNMLKPGGLMVYSTCSILPSENQEQVKKFINAHAENYQLVEEKHIWPSEGFDGFYMALIRKKS